MVPGEDLNRTVNSFPGLFRPSLNDWSEPAQRSFSNATGPEVSHRLSLVWFSCFSGCAVIAREERSSVCVRGGGGTRGGERRGERGLVAGRGGTGEGRRGSNTHDQQYARKGHPEGARSHPTIVLCQAPGLSWCPSITGQSFLLCSCLSNCLPQDCDIKCSQ